MSNSIFLSRNFNHPESTTILEIHDFIQKRFQSPKRTDLLHIQLKKSFPAINMENSHLNLKCLHHLGSHNKTQNSAIRTELAIPRTRRYNEPWVPSPKTCKKNINSQICTAEIIFRLNQRVRTAQFDTVLSKRGVGTAQLKKVIILKMRASTCSPKSVPRANPHLETPTTDTSFT